MVASSHLGESEVTHTERRMLHDMIDVEMKTKNERR